MTMVYLVMRVSLVVVRTELPWPPGHTRKGVGELGVNAKKIYL